MNMNLAKEFFFKVDEKVGKFRENLNNLLQVPKVNITSPKNNKGVIGIMKNQARKRLIK